MDFKKGVISVLITNVIKLCLSIITGFIIPKMLPIDQYGYIKVYQLYVSYVTLLGLGYADGIYLKYGGKKLKDIDYLELANEYKTFMLLQVIITVLFLIYSLISKDFILLVFAFSILVINCSTFFQMYFQAIGEFLKYSILININTISTFVGNIILIFILKVTDYKYYIILYLLSSLIVFILLYIWYKKELKTGKIKLYLFKENISNGFLLMLGNLAFTMLVGLDKWFIKFLFSINHFSYYSFVVSLMNIINLFTNSITLTMYNYFSINTEVEVRIKVKRVLMIFSYSLLMVVFPLKYIIIHYIPQYIPALNIMIILFACHSLVIINCAIYVNLYKVNHLQKRYFMKLISCIILAGLFNIIFYLIDKRMESISIATFFSTVIWYILSERDFKELRTDLKEFIFHSTLIIGFVIFGIYLKPLMGLFMYTILISLISIILFKEYINYIFLNIKGVVNVKKILNKKH